MAALALSSQKSHGSAIGRRDHWADRYCAGSILPATIRPRRKIESRHRDSPQDCHAVLQCAASRYGSRRSGGIILRDPLSGAGCQKSTSACQGLRIHSASSRDAGRRAGRFLAGGAPRDPCLPSAARRAAIGSHNHLGDGAGACLSSCRITRRCSALWPLIERSISNRVSMRRTASMASGEITPGVMPREQMNVTKPRRAYGRPRDCPAQSASCISVIADVKLTFAVSGR